MSRPPFDLGMVDAGTAIGMANGHRVFQTHKFGPTDRDHVGVLLSFLRPINDGAIILDAGCGIGEVSRLMAQAMPAAGFVLANLSRLQLSHCPIGPQFKHLYADCHALPMQAGEVDAVMFSSALCQMDEALALAEARRVLVPGGVLLLNELVRHESVPGNDLLERNLGCRVLPSTALAQVLTDNLFAIERMETPAYDDSHFRILLREAGIEAGLDGVLPCVIRAVRVA